MDIMHGLCDNAREWTTELLLRLDGVYKESMFRNTIRAMGTEKDAWAAYRSAVASILGDAGFDVAELTAVFPVDMPEIPVPLITATYIEDLNNAWARVDAPLKEVSHSSST